MPEIHWALYFGLAALAALPWRASLQAPLFGPPAPPMPITTAPQSVGRSGDKPGGKGAGRPQDKDMQNRGKDGTELPVKVGGTGGGAGAGVPPRNGGTPNINRLEPGGQSKQIIIGGEPGATGDGRHEAKPGGSNGSATAVPMDGNEGNQLPNGGPRDVQLGDSAAPKYGKATKKVIDEINNKNNKAYDELGKRIHQELDNIKKKTALDPTDENRLKEAFKKDREEEEKGRPKEKKTESTPVPQTSLQEKAAGLPNGPQKPPATPDSGVEKVYNLFEWADQNLGKAGGLFFRQNPLIVLAASHLASILIGAGLLVVGGVLTRRLGNRGGLAKPTNGSVEKPSRKPTRLGPALSRKVPIKTFPASSPKNQHRAMEICAAWESQPKGARWDSRQVEVARDFIRQLSEGPGEGSTADRDMFILRYWARYVCQFEPKEGNWAWSAMMANSALPIDLEIRTRLPVLGTSYAENRSLVDELEGDGPVLVKVLRPFLHLVNKTNQQTVAEYPGCGVLGSPNDVGGA